MLATFKMIGLAAALSAGAVTAYELPEARDVATPGKTYYDRVLPSDPIEAPKATTVALVTPEHTGTVKQDGKGDQLRSTNPSCASQTWPNISRDCIVSENGAPVRKPARTITIERRESASSSTLVRVPASNLATR
jgi:hypothetical protein